jgi:DNA repair exonuclease SbcCD ATPase subunit
LRLKNFKGIMAAMGVKEIEIDFTEALDKRIILLVGANGSGKSTIMSCLHPFAETFDDRAEIILEGAEGEKEIYIEHNGETYRILHIYGKKMRSFMWRIIDEEESENINESGGVKTFQAKVKEIFGLDSELFKVVRVGSNAKNFIDLIASQRKVYIGRFTPSIDEYVEAYKIVNEKLNVSNKEIKYVSDEVAKIESREELDAKIGVADRVVKRHQKAIVDLQVEKGTAETGLQNAKDSVEEDKEELAEFESIPEAMTEQQATIDEIGEKWAVLKDQTIPEVEERISTTETKLATTKKDLATEQGKLVGLQEERGRKAKELTEAATEEKKYSSQTNRDNSADAIQKRVDEAKEVLGEEEPNVKTSFPLDLDPSDVSDAVVWLKRYGADVIEARRRVIGHFESVGEASETIFSEAFEDMESLVKQAEKDVTEAKKVLDDAKKDLRTAENKALENSASVKVASMCKTPSCKVYQLGQELKAEAGRVSELKEAVEQAEAALKEHTDHLETLESLKDDVLFFRSGVAKAITKRGNTAKFSQFLALVLKENNPVKMGSMIFDRAPDAIEKAFDLTSAHNGYKILQRRSIAQKTVEEGEERLRLLRGNEELMNSIRQRKSDCLDAIEKLDTSIADSQEKVTELQKAQTRQENSLAILQELLEALKEVQRLEARKKVLQKVYNRNAKAIEAINTHQTKIAELSKQIAEAEEHKQNAEDDLSKLKAALARRDDFEERLARMETDRESLKTLKEVLDVRTGIPLFLVGDYLNGIRDETNGLLNLAFGESFKIGFEVSDTDFSIPVWRNGIRYANDVLECSQGEKALVKCSLSLGIAKKAADQSKPAEGMQGFNLVYLDEVDAELDTENRRNFLAILEKQLDKLKNEQCFVISHNDAFDDAEVGVVLLKGAKLDTEDENAMFNKTVIADFRR